MTGNVRFGKCSLTGSEGRFVKSHIIPEALTETSWNGQALTQNGRYGRRVKRWTSWYDFRLVTQEGEAILSSYDDWAIKFFRQHKLIWSSWGAMEELETSDHKWGPDRAFGFRELVEVDSRRLRQFFLSLLWRSALTTLFEFKAVSIDPSDIDQLTQMVLTGRVEPYEFYPVTLTQLSTRNFPHNRSASYRIKQEPTLDEYGNFLDAAGREVPHYRFFFDGLIAHMHLGEDVERVQKLDRVFVGPSRNIAILTLPSEDSEEMKRFWHETGGWTPPPDLARKSYLF